MTVLTLLGIALGWHGLAVVWIERLRRRMRPTRVWGLLALGLLLLMGWHGSLFFAALVEEPVKQPEVAIAGLAVLLAGGGLASLAGLLAWVRTLQEGHLLAMQSAADELQHQQAEFDAIFNALPVEMRVLDTAQRLTHVNRAAAVAAGVDSTTLEGSAWWQNAPGGLTPEVYEEDLVVLQTGEPQHGLRRSRSTVTGRTRWLQIDKMPYRDQRGQIAGLVECAVDVTARQQTEAALTRRIAQMQMIHTIAQELTRELDFQPLLQLLVQRTTDLLHASRSVLYLWDEGTETLHPQAWWNAPDWLGELRLKRGEGLVGVVAERRAGVRVHDTQQAPMPSPRSSTPRGRQRRWRSRCFTGTGSWACWW